MNVKQLFDLTGRVAIVTEGYTGIGRQMGEDLLRSIPARRFGGENDLKGATVLLASSASDYIVGQVIVVDGGTLARY